MDKTEEWINENNALSKTFVFKDFIEAVSFVNETVPLAEKLQHHPDVEIFAYNKVKVTLSTHEEGDKVTEKDTELSKEIDNLFARASEWLGQEGACGGGGCGNCQCK